MLYYNTTHLEDRMKLEYSGNVNDIMKQIKHIMIDKGLRQKDICNITGWSRQTVSNLLAGRTPNPGINIIYTLCKAIGCNLYIDIRLIA